MNMVKLFLTIIYTFNKLEFAKIVRWTASLTILQISAAKNG